MRKLFLLLLIFSSKIVAAQDFPDMRSWAIYGDSTERYIFSDTAFIRSSPDTKQPPIDTLLAGDNILVLNVTNKPLTIRGIKGPWLKINYTKNGEQKNGYVWQGLISCAPLRRGDTKFVYGIERRADSIAIDGKKRDTIPQFLVRLKVVQNGKIITKSSLIVSDDESANFSGGKIMSGMGLSNVQNIIILSFSGEACGIPTYDYYFAWTADSKLVQLPHKTSIGDADVFYHSENFIFPNEKNGKPDLIVWEMSTEEATEKVDKNGLSIMKVTGRGKTTYQWDGVNGTITEIKGK
ncbi:SH3 domain-containing protein [Chitinophaga silvatica]|uniref:SH3 domain-containing protein n=1 Tax=Chitinophaga silvatica TaxID=2282649 RepID=A0A3E1Y698_9BACT|nr:SH3 domain-containing protein [Chitinophaga silvatica]RFS20472.1 SH3 domain-containing protein [Chitinophaga silvatica]